MAARARIIARPTHFSISTEEGRLKARALTTVQVTWASTSGDGNDLWVFIRADSVENHASSDFRLPAP